MALKMLALLQPCGFKGFLMYYTSVRFLQAVMSTEHVRVKEKKALHHGSLVFLHCNKMEMYSFLSLCLYLRRAD